MCQNCQYGWVASGHRSQSSSKKCYLTQNAQFTFLNFIEDSRNAFVAGNELQTARFIEHYLVMGLGNDLVLV